jgi:hypothetical protein
MHPFTSNDVARARSDEKLARGLAAYRALSVQEEQAAGPGIEAGTAGRVGLLDRLRRRHADTPAPARPAI